MRKGRAITEVIFTIANAIAVVVVIGIITYMLFPGLFTFFEEAPTSREVQQLIDDIDREVCTGNQEKGTFPPPGSSRDEYNFRDVDSIGTEGDEFTVLVEGADQARTIETECEDIDNIYLCEDEERDQDITQCDPPGEELPSGGYSFIYRVINNDLYIMEEREIIDEGPFIYYLSRDAGDYGLRYVSISEDIVYSPENEYAGATTTGDYQGRTLSFSGDLRMIGFDSGSVFGNHTDFFSYEKTDHSTSSIRHGKPISVHDLGGIGMLREGEIEEEREGEYCGQWVTDENIRDMARIMWVEARGQSREARIAIGYTVLRTMVEWGAEEIGVGEEGMPITRYGHGETGQKHMYYEGTEERWEDIGRNEYGEFEETAEQVLRCEVPDLGQGATHYYSPYSMPDTEGETYDFIETGSVSEADETFDILPSEECHNYIGSEITKEDLVEELVEGRYNYIPRWANQNLAQVSTDHPCYSPAFDRVDVSEVGEYEFTFFRNEDWKDFEFYERDFGEWGGNEVFFVNGTITGEEKSICMYNYLDERSLECISNQDACRADFVGDVGNPGGEDNKIFFGDRSENIYHWDGEGGDLDMDDCAQESMEHTEEYQVRDYDCGNFEGGTQYDIIDMSTFTQVPGSEGEPRENDMVVLARDQDVGRGRDPTSIGYINFEDVCGDGGQRLNLEILHEEPGIVSIGETLDGKVPYIVYSTEGEYELKYYDIEEEEVETVKPAEGPVRAGSFSDIGG